MPRGALAHSACVSCVVRLRTGRATNVYDETESIVYHGSHYTIVSKRRRSGASVGMQDAIVWPDRERLLAIRPGFLRKNPSSQGRIRVPEKVICKMSSAHFVTPSREGLHDYLFRHNHNTLRETQWLPLVFVGEIIRRSKTVVVDDKGIEKVTDGECTITLSTLLDLNQPFQKFDYRVWQQRMKDENPIRQARQSLPLS